MTDVLRIDGVPPQVVGDLGDQQIAPCHVAGITSVLVFGAATDYALLLIARYREELRRVPDRFAAMRTALRRTAEPVLASGFTVVLGVLALLLSEQESNRALAVACATGVVLAMVSALVVLPAALVLLGRGIFWPFVPRMGGAAREGRVWGRLGAAVARRPVPVAGLATVLLAGLALGGPRRRVRPPGRGGRYRRPDRRRADGAH